MNNHQIVIYEAKGVLKTALKVGMGIKLGLELGDFIYYVALGAMGKLGGQIFHRTG